MYTPRRTASYKALTVGLALGAAALHGCGPRATQIPVSGDIKPDVQALYATDGSPGGYAVDVKLRTPEKSADPHIKAGEMVRVKVGRNQDTAGLDGRVNEAYPGGIRKRDCTITGTVTSYGADQGIKPYDMSGTTIQCKDLADSVEEKVKGTLDRWLQRGSELVGKGTKAADKYLGGKQDTPDN